MCGAPLISRLNIFGILPTLLKERLKDDHAECTAHVPRLS